MGRDFGKSKPVFNRRSGAGARRRPGGCRDFLRSACATVLALGCGISVAAAQPAVIIERGVMPAPRVEVIPAVPGPGYNWVPGHWAWRGTGWVWIAGHHIRGVVPAMPV